MHSPTAAGEHRKRLFPSSEGACWSVRYTTTKAEFFWLIRCIISLFLSLCLVPTLFLSISRAGLLLSFLVPHNFLPTPHLLPSPPSLLSPLPCLSPLVCRQESKHWKAYAYCLSRTGQDNQQSYIKVNGISRYSSTVLLRHTDRKGIGSFFSWHLSNPVSPRVVMRWC